MIDQMDFDRSINVNQNTYRPSVDQVEHQESCEVELKEPTQHLTSIKHNDNLD